MAKQALATKQDIEGITTGYALTQMDPAELRELVEDNIGAEGLNIQDLPKIKIPAGGGVAFEVDTPEGPEPMKLVKGVIVGWHQARVYFDKPFGGAGSGEPPLCFSADGMVGRGDPFRQGQVSTRDCRTCPLSEFGTKVDQAGKIGRGKACPERRVLFLMMQGDMLPHVMSVPPTSLGDMRKFFTGLVVSGTSFYGVEIELSLTKDRNKDGTEYSKVQVRATGKMDKPEAGFWKNVKESLAPKLLGTMSTSADFIAGGGSTGQGVEIDDTQGDPFKEE